MNYRMSDDIDDLFYEFILLNDPFQAKGMDLFESIYRYGRSLVLDKEVGAILYSERFVD